MNDFFKEHETAGYVLKGVGSATAGVMVGFAIICLLRFFGLVPGGPEDVRTTVCLLGLLWLAMLVMRLYMGLSGKWRE